MTEMSLTRERMLRSMLARDPRYDRRFITGVVATGILVVAGIAVAAPFLGRPSRALKRWRPGSRNPTRSAAGSTASTS